MAKPPIPVNRKADIGNDAKELFAAFLTQLKSKLEADSRLFPSGIELIKLTLKAGSNYEFSVVIAGKDAPKVENLLVSE